MMTVYYDNAFCPFYFFVKINHRALGLPGIEPTTTLWRSFKIIGGNVLFEVKIMVIS